MNEQENVEESKLMVDLMDFVIIDGDEFDRGHLECPVPGCHWVGDDFWSSSTTVGDLIADATAHRAARHPDTP